MSLSELSTLSPSEKLFIIETLWNQLEDQDVPSPKWHRALLEERKERYLKGEEGPLLTLEEFKQLQGG